MENKKQKVVYCHFSFRRPRGKDYGLFAVALYSDFEGKKLVAAKTKALKLWKDHQHVTAIQSYSNALDCIWEWQSKLKHYGVTNILLVTNNSTLEGWILNPKKNKNYTAYMEKAVEPYKTCGKKEILLSVGMTEARDSEKSHKYCREDLVCNRSELNKENNHECRLGITEYKSMAEIVDENKPEGLYSM